MVWPASCPAPRCPTSEMLSIARNCPSGAIVLRRDGEVVDLPTVIRA